MAKAKLPVNFKDDILKENMNGKRRFKMIQNTDGTVSFEDVTDYTQVGSTFGAAQINATNEAVNNAADASKIMDDLETIKANTQSGYIAGALAVKKLSSNLGGKIGSFNGKTEKTFNYPSSAKYLVLENTGTGTYATFGMLLIDLSNKKFVGCTVSSNGTSYPSYGTNYNDTIHVVDFDNHTITQKIGTNNWTGMPLDVYAL